MITLEIPDTNRKLYLPTNLSECDSNQYADMALLIYNYQQKVIDYLAFRVQAIYLLLKLKPATNPNNDIQEEKMANIFGLSEFIDEFFEDVEDTKILKQYYTHNPVQKIRPILKAYYGPTDHFDNFKFGEYIDALHYFSEYNTTKDPELLYMLMAVMYRPGKHFHFLKKRMLSYDGDIREPYNQHTVESRAKKLKLIHFGEVYGFYLLFASFQKYLISAKIYWQGRELDLSILFASDEKTQESNIPGIGMKSILYTMAESGVFGPIKDLRQESGWEILLRMYDVTKRDLDYKASTKQNTNATNA